MTLDKKCTISSTRLFCIATIIAPLLYAMMILFYAVNIPVGDDYSLLAFMNDFHFSISVNEKINLLLSLHNEHRIVLTRIISLLVKAVFGALDFRILIFIGNAVFFIAVFQIGKALGFRRDMFKWALLFLLAIQPQTLKLMFYPMAIIQAYCGLLFLVMYLCFLSEKKNIIFPLSMYLLAVIASASGFFLICIGAPLLVYQKRWKELIIHLFFSLITAFLYFFNLPSNGLSKLYYILLHPLQSSTFFLCLLGNISQAPHVIDPYHYASLFFGMILIAYLSFHIKKTIQEKYTKRKKIYCQQLIFLLSFLMIISLIVLGRTEIYHENLKQAALDGRYRIYGILFTAVSIIAFLQFVPIRKYLNTRIKMIIILIAFIFNVSWFIKSYITVRHNTRVQCNAMKSFLNDNNAVDLATWAVPKAKAVKSLELAIALGIYKPYSDPNPNIGDK